MRFDQVMVMDEFRFGAECESLRFPALARMDAIRPGIAGWFLSIAAVLGVLALGVSISKQQDHVPAVAPFSGNGSLTAPAA